jgi:hypothetical protein
MYVLNVRNVQEGLVEGLELIQRGDKRDSRNGPVLQYRTPVSTVYFRPTERVLFHPWRDANPFFHFYESLWMLAGRNDVAPLTRYVKRMADFSDDGETFNAAYGHRWRHATKIDIDQLTRIISGLQINPECRRQVLKIWAIKHDLARATKDAACNLAATFQINPEGELDMAVFCRSNDIIWGCYGANAVHFSMLQEYIARSVGVRIGKYTQISVNYHAYENVLRPMLAMASTPGNYGADPYWNNQVKPFPIMYVTQDEWDEDVKRFVTMDGSAPKETVFNDPFFTDVAYPIVLAHDHYKNGDWQSAVDIASLCQATDWRLACTQWLERRRKS